MYFYIRFFPKPDTEEGVIMGQMLCAVLILLLAAVPLAALAAEALGYRNVKSMAGGIVAWAQAQLPINYPG